MQGSTSKGKKSSAERIPLWKYAVFNQTHRCTRSKTMTTISTKSTEGGLVITSNDGHLDSASAVLEIRATNPEYNQPVLRIRQAGERGGAASIRIDDPNPDIELVETGLTGPDPGAGKFEIAVQADRLQINGRRAAVTASEKGSDLSHAEPSYDSLAECGETG
jgi:hypothetical protein